MPGMTGNLGGQSLREEGLEGGDGRDQHLGTWSWPPPSSWSLVLGLDRSSREDWARFLAPPEILTRPSGTPSRGAWDLVWICLVLSQ